LSLYYYYHGEMVFIAEVFWNGIFITTRANFQECLVSTRSLIPKTTFFVAIHSKNKALETSRDIPGPTNNTIMNNAIS